MSYCRTCGKEIPQDDSFCPDCATDTGTAESHPGQPVENKPVQSRSEWASFERMINTYAGIMGTLGAVLTIISVSLPWANLPIETVLDGIGEFGKAVGLDVSGTTIPVHTKLAWPIGIAAAVGFVCLLKRGAGVVTGVVGCLTAGYALFSCFGLSGNGSTLAPGVFFALLGGVMTAYAGFSAERAAKTKGA